MVRALAKALDRHGWAAGGDVGREAGGAGEAAGRHAPRRRPPQPAPPRVAVPGRDDGAAVARGAQPARRDTAAAPSSSAPRTPRAALLTRRRLARASDPRGQGVEEPGIALAFGSYRRRRARPGGAARPVNGSPRRSAPPGRSRTPCSASAPGEPTHPWRRSRSSPSSSRPPSLGSVPHVGARAAGPPLDHLARRVLTVGFAAACFQPLYNSGDVRAAGSGPGRTALLPARPARR